jgi:hypothetical protein
VDRVCANLHSLLRLRRRPARESKGEETMKQIMAGMSFSIASFIVIVIIGETSTMSVALKNEGAGLAAMFVFLGTVSALMP